jgi:starvation-inducible DNA-binding protein
VLAERIRALCEKAPGSGSEFKKLSTISEGNSELNSDQMLKDLYESNQVIITTLKKALGVAEKANDVSTADMLTQRITTHDKASWMLKSSLPSNSKIKLAV